LPVDAFSTWRHGHPVIAIAKKNERMTKKAFYLLHELGHIKYHPEGSFVMTKYYDRDDPREKEADFYARDNMASLDAELYSLL